VEKLKDTVEKDYQLLEEPLLITMVLNEQILKEFFVIWYWANAR
jgi:hypothetical protein